MDPIISPLDCHLIQVLGHCKNTSLLLKLGLPTLDSYVSSNSQRCSESNLWFTDPSYDNFVEAIKW